jgi:hypothetical protein
MESDKASSVFDNQKSEIDFDRKTTFVVEKLEEENQ